LYFNCTELLTGALSLTRQKYDKKIRKKGVNSGIDKNNVYDIAFIPLL